MRMPFNHAWNMFITRIATILSAWPDEYVIYINYYEMKISEKSFDVATLFNNHFANFKERLLNILSLVVLVHHQKWIERYINRYFAA